MKCVGVCIEAHDVTLDCKGAHYINEEKARSRRWRRGGGGGRAKYWDEEFKTPSRLPRIIHFVSLFLDLLLLLFVVSGRRERVGPWQSTSSQVVRDTFR